MKTNSVAQLQAAFNGRIVKFTGEESPFMEIRCPHTVFYPTSEADLIIALQLAHTIQQPMRIQSGSHFTYPVTDFHDGIVINLQQFFANIKINADAETVVVGAAVTTAQLAQMLANHNRFLPLDENPVLSVLADVATSKNRRSAASLKCHVQSIRVISFKNFQPRTLFPNDELFQKLLKGETAISSSAIVVAMTFSTALAEGQTPWLSKWELPYAGDSLDELLDLLFAYNWSAAVDLSVKVAMNSHFTPYLFVRLAGSKYNEQLMAKKVVNAAIDQVILRGHEQPLLNQQDFNTPGTVVAAWVSSGLGGGNEHEEPCTKFEQSFIRKQAENTHHGGLIGFLQWFTEITAICYPNRPSGSVRTISAGPPSKSKQPSFDREITKKFADAVTFALGPDSAAYGTRGSAELALTCDNLVQTTVHLFKYWQQHEHDRQAFDKMSSVLPEIVPRMPSKLKDGEVSPPPSSTSTWCSDLSISPPSSLSSSPVDVTSDRVFNVNDYKSQAAIPNFRGDIIVKAAMIKNNNMAEYRRHADQYATSSLTEQEIQQRMSPNMIAYPTDAQDVSTAIQFAKQIGKKIVARSGGHQYCGLSSGGDDTILLSMDAFNTITIEGERATVGVGCLLKDVSAKLKACGMTVPHGECPRVAIGGHIQTGGFGHLLTTYGLLMDRVHALKIVTADGIERTLVRPRADCKKDADGELFAAVLGGGPGSFGVLTEIVLDCIQDFPAYGYQAPIFYQKKVFLAAMKEMQRFTRMVASDNPPEGIDFGLTVGSGHTQATIVDGECVVPNVVVLEFLDIKAADADGNRNLNGPNQQFIQSVIKNVMEEKSFWNISKPVYDAMLPLSTITASIIRREGVMTTLNGREFAFPYKKRLNCSKKPLSDAFVTKFVDLVDETMDMGLNVIFQCGTGGGPFAKPKNPTSTMQQHRDTLVYIMFDIFYPPGYEEMALAQQVKMRKLLKYFSDGEDIRLFWGTYAENSDPSELHIENVVEKYYNDRETYRRIQQIKQRVDPGNVFSTSFTVQLPRS